MEALRLPLRFHLVFAQGKLLTSNCERGVSILYLGKFACPERSRRVYSLYRVDAKLSTQSIISILSTLFAPQLHRKSALRADLKGTPYPTEDRGGLRPRRRQTDLSIPVVSLANIPSLYPRRSQSDVSNN